MHDARLNPFCVAYLVRRVAKIAWEGLRAFDDKGP